MEKEQEKLWGIFCEIERKYISLLIIVGSDRMKRSLVSIIIPIYNVEKYLRECLENVINQTYNEIEIICVEDVSTDNSLEILREYEGRDTRIKVIMNEKNRGLSYARNRGFREATGKYLYYLDSDDYIERNAIEKLCLYAEHYNTDGIYFDSRLLEETEGLGSPPLQYRLPNIDKKIYEGPKLFKILKENNVYVNSVWRCFWKREFLEQYKLEFADGLLAEDQLFSLKGILLGKRMMVINENYHVYRRREGTLSTKVTPLMMISLFKNYCALLEFWNEHSFEKEVQSIISDHLMNILINAKREYARYGELISREDFEEGAERHLFEVLVLQEYEKSLSKIGDTILQKIRKAEKVIIYGAGRYALEVTEKLNRNGVSVACYAVTKIHQNMKNINGTPIYEIADLLDLKEKAIIVVGVAGRNRDEVIKTLKEYGFFQYVLLD